MPGLFLQQTFGKARFEDIDYSDLMSFLAQKIPEHQNLEYKSGEVVVGSDGKLLRPTTRHEVFGVVEVAKAVAGLANAEGGLLVLGVRQKPERHRGVVTRILPGAVRGVPANITREAIENLLRELIKYPLDGMTIWPVRKTERHKSFVYLIDVPQSTHPPHRVNEMYYFQRHNFSTDHMLHYQIADLFGRRLGPDLEIEIPSPAPHHTGEGRFSVSPSIRNGGNVVAKYVLVVIAITGGDYAIIWGGNNTTWQVRPDQRSAQFKLGINDVVYPDTPTRTGDLFIGPTGGPDLDITLRVLMFAESMPAKESLVAFTRDVLPPQPQPETEVQRLLREELDQARREQAGEADG